MGCVSNLRERGSSSDNALDVGGSPSGYHMVQYMVVVSSCLIRENDVFRVHVCSFNLKEITTLAASEVLIVLIGIVRMFSLVAKLRVLLDRPDLPSLEERRGTNQLNVCTAIAFMRLAGFNMTGQYL